MIIVNVCEWMDAIKAGAKANWSLFEDPKMENWLPMDRRNRGTFVQLFVLILTATAGYQNALLNWVWGWKWLSCQLKNKRE